MTGLGHGEGRAESCDASLSLLELGPYIAHTGVIGDNPHILRFTSSHPHLEVGEFTFDNLREGVPCIGLAFRYCAVYYCVVPFTKEAPMREAQILQTA